MQESKAFKCKYITSLLFSFVLLLHVEMNSIFMYTQHLTQCGQTLLPQYISGLTESIHRDKEELKIHRSA